MINILKKLKSNLKMAESSRLISSDKRKSKRSKLAGAAIYWTNFKAEWKKKSPFITRVPNDVAGRGYN